MRSLSSKVLMAKATLFVLFFFAGLMLFKGCTGTAGLDPGAITDLEPKQRVIVMQNIYNSQYADYMAQVGYAFDDGKWQKVTDVDLSDDRKAILKTKKSVLEKVYPLIEIYDTYVMADSSPPMQLENQIMNLLDSLVIQLE